MTATLRILAPDQDHELRPLGAEVWVVLYQREWRRCACCPSCEARGEFGRHAPSSGRIVAMRAELKAELPGVGPSVLLEVSYTVRVSGEAHVQGRSADRVFDTEAEAYATIPEGRGDWRHVVEGGGL